MTDMTKGILSLQKKGIISELDAALLIRNHLFGQNDRIYIERTPQKPVDFTLDDAKQFLRIVMRNEELAHDSEWLERRLDGVDRIMVSLLAYP
ncbi:MAG: hypothetical protein WAX89_06440, partial [Alphaproteobacteria bacterium]